VEGVVLLAVIIGIIWGAVVLNKKPEHRAGWVIVTRPKQRASGCAVIIAAGLVLALAASVALALCR
jgi:hypothetical protein